jgi:hypothetical protein
MFLYQSRRVPGLPITNRECEAGSQPSQPISAALLLLAVVAMPLRQAYGCVKEAAQLCSRTAATVPSQQQHTSTDSAGASAHDSTPPHTCSPPRSTCPCILGSVTWHALRGLPHSARRGGRSCRYTTGNAEQTARQDTWVTRAVCFSINSKPHRRHSSLPSAGQVSGSPRAEHLQQQATRAGSLQGAAPPGRTPLVVLVYVYRQVGPPQERLGEGCAVVQPHTQLNQG